MPVYEYNCHQCGHSFEKLVFDQNSAIVCPECRSANIEKQFSMFATTVKSESKMAGQCSAGMGPCNVPGCTNLNN